MYTLIGFAIIGACFGLWSTRKYPRNIHDLGLYFGGFIGLAFGGLVAMMLTEVGMHRVYEVSEPSNLLPIRLSDSLNGSYLLASRHIGERTDYVYNQETPEGGYQPERVNDGAFDVTVFEVDGLQGGTLTVIECHRVRNQAWTDKFTLWNIAPCGQKYEFRIPKGSLVQQLTIQ